MKRLFTTLAAVAVFFTACSHAQKSTPELSKLEGKKVALISIDGEETDRKLIEVSLINQLLKRGTFELVSKQDVEAARAAPEQDPMDWMGIAKRAGADYALRAKVLELAADVHEGYSSEIIDDSQMAAERGEEERKTEHLYKVKSLEGKMKVELQFANVATREIKTGIAEGTDKAVSEARTEAAHLPPKLRFLEKIANDAFQKFFDQYQ